MSPETFTAIAPTVPVRYPLTHETFGSTYDFGVIRDDQGEPLAILREPYAEQDLAEGLRQYRLLGSYGIATTECLPYINPDGTKLILSRYIEGNDWDVDTPSVSPSDSLAHALKLGNYYSRRILDGKPVLVDILQPFQYKVVAGTPILIDTDLVLLERPNRKHLDEEFEWITKFYQPLIPSDWRPGLRTALDSLVNQYELSRRA